MNALSFYGFCEVDSQGNVVTDKVDVFNVIHATNINDLNYLIQNPPQPYAAVFSDGTVLSVPDLFKAVEVTPVRNSDGIFIRQRALVPFTTDETVEYLKVLRDQKNREITAARLQANDTYFMHLGKKIACDKVSKDDIFGTNGEIVGTGRMPDGWIGGWKAMDNTFIPIHTVAEWRDFYSSMFQQGNINFRHAQELKSRVANAGSIAEIKAIKWNTPTGLAASVIPETA